MRIGIEINGVLRDTLGKIEQTYQKFLIDKTDGIEDDESFEYKMTYPINSLTLNDHFSFPDDDELYSFLYEEFAMEIFGHAQSSEYNTFIDLNEIYISLRDNHDLLIVSDEIGKSKPASLFFISKFGCLVESVKFYSESTINSLWDSVDILLTANPKLLLNHPKNKIVIKFNTTYNEGIESDFNISSLKELKTKIQEIA
jgi:hypothetical protein